jgi:TfoX/Sxy family transcriptional regulator of competence genes
MANDQLADRVRAMLGPLPVTEQRMFGGVCFMLNGNMLLGASPRGLLVRVGKEESDAALRRPHARLMEQRGRTMAGYIVVANEGISRDRDLKNWLELAVAHVSTLPSKQARPRKGRPGRKT